MYYSLIRKDQDGNLPLAKEGDLTLNVQNGEVKTGFVSAKTGDATELFDIKNGWATPSESLKDQGFKSPGSLEGNFYNSKSTEDTKYFGGEVKANEWNAVFGTTKESK